MGIIPRRNKAPPNLEIKILVPLLDSGFSYPAPLGAGIFSNGYTCGFAFPTPGNGRLVRFFRGTRRRTVGGRSAGIASSLDQPPGRECHRHRMGHRVLQSIDKERGDGGWKRWGASIRRPSLPIIGRLSPRERGARRYAQPPAGRAVAASGPTPALTACVIVP